MASFSIASVFEDVLREQEASSGEIGLASRKAEESSLRRYEAARWLRKMVGVVLGKDLPAEPSDDDFRIGLRSGVILCTVLNKIQPGAISKVVEVSNDSVIIPDGAASMAYQYFENVRNFLLVVDEMGIPTFEASDFEKGGNTSRIVNCVVGLKSYAEWKQGGCSGSWKFGANVKASNTAKPIARMNSEPFVNSISRSSSFSEKSLESISVDAESSPAFKNASKNHSIGRLIRSVLSGKKQDEIPSIVESMLSKVMEELEHRLDIQGELVRTPSTHSSLSDLNRSPTGPSMPNMQPSFCDEMTEVDDKNNAPMSVHPYTCDETDYKNAALFDEKTPTVGKSIRPMSIEEDGNMQNVYEKGLSKFNLGKQLCVFEQQRKDFKELKYTVHSTKESIHELQMKYQEDMKNIGNQLYRLAYAASGYQRVLAENRKLYNIVQDLKGNIRVYCRVRPFLPGQTISSTAVERIEEGTITIRTPQKYCKEGWKSFTFNKVFGASATQVEVFADTQPLVRSVLDGYNVCIFAYGQTGSGKTFTMSGPDNLTEEMFGVNYRALNDLFFLSDQRKGTVSYEVSVQMMEIYNEQVRDLLATDSSTKKLEIRNSSQNGINVPDANLIPVSSTDDVVRLMNLGQKNRAVSATAMNDRSSRSHSCLMVHVQGREVASGTILRGCMHLVDLAGSERVEKSEVTGDRLKEAVHINKSLSALGDVVAALAQKGAHVPYRNSKLTQLLQDSLGGQAKTLMFVHIAPDPDAVGETLSTLKFAERVSLVELGAAQINKENGDVKELKEQIANLKAALAKKEEEQEVLSNSVLSSGPESQKTKSTLSSPCHPSLQSSKEVANGRRSPKEGKTSSGPVSNARRRSLDSRDLSDWPPLGARRGTSEWVDKIPVKRDSVDRSRSLITLEDKGRSRLAAPYRDALKPSSEAAPADEIDESEVATTPTSDSSEIDFQAPIKRISSMPDGLAESKLRKPQSRTIRSQDVRSMIPPPPTRRQSMGSGPLPSSGKNEKQVVYLKRKNANSK